MSVPIPNYTQTPNVLFDEHLPDMKLAELKVTLAIIRKIIGWHKENPEPISYSQLKKLTGLSVSNVAKGVQDALDRGTVKLAGTGKRGVKLYTLNFATIPKTSIDDPATIPETGTVTIPRTGNTKESTKEIKDSKKKDSPVSEKEPDTTSLKQKDVGTGKVPPLELAQQAREKLNAHKPPRIIGPREAQATGALKLEDVPRDETPRRHNIVGRTCENCLAAATTKFQYSAGMIVLCDQCAALVGALPVKDVGDGSVPPAVSAQNGSVTDSRTREKPKKERSAKQKANDVKIEALGKAWGIEAVGKDCSLYMKIANTLIEAGVETDDFKNYIDYWRKFFRDNYKGATLTLPSLTSGGRPSEYIAWKKGNGTVTKPIATPYSPNTSALWSGGGDDTGE